MPLTEPQAKEVWGVMSEHSQQPFPAEARRDFVYRMAHGCIEYSLPSGATLYIERRGLRVAYHQDDETPARLAAIEKTNARLAALWETWNGE